MTTAPELHRVGSSCARPAARGALWVLSVVGLLLPLVMPACAPARVELTPPELLTSPYGVSAEPLWAVAPLRNESGTSAADAMLASDALVARIAEIRGITCLPMNRTLAAMRALRMSSIQSAEDAQALADALGVDAIVAGSLTAWDPYTPPKVGMAIGLYPGRRSAMVRASRFADAKSMQLAANEGSGVVQSGAQPLSVVAEHLDATNHAVLFNVRRYAEGRHDFDTAFGWRRYTASMDLYVEFGAYWTIYRLLQEERVRVGRPERSG